MAAAVPGQLESMILRTVRRSRLRLVAGKLSGALADALALGLLLFLAFGTAERAAQLGRAGWVLFWILLSLLLCSYIAWTVLSGTSLRAVAIVLDRRMGFHDRVSSALAFLGASTITPFMHAHLEETAAFLERHGEAVLPVAWPGRGRAFAVFLVLALVALLPHGDRLMLQEQDRRTRVEEQVKAARALVREMDQLRQKADLQGLHKLSAMVAAVEKELNRQVQLMTPEDLNPPTPENQPEPEGSTEPAEAKSEDEGKKPPGTPAGNSAPQEGMRLSSAATYQPVGKFDSFPEAVYTEVFAELDGIVVDTPMTGKELKNLAEHVDTTAGQLNNYAFMQDKEATGYEGSRRNPGGERMPENSMEKSLAPLEYKAFSEFLKRYAAHLGDKALGQAKMELSDKENTGGEQFNISAPPPKDAKFALKGVSDQRPDLPLLQATDAQMRQIASQVAPQNGPPSKSGSRGTGTELGGSGAGVGASEHTGAAPEILPRAEGGSYLPLKGKLGDGQSFIQLINDRGRHNLATPALGKVSYRDVFLEYAHGAEAEVNSEQVPAAMRDYIRDYFRSIRPAAEAGESPKTP